MNHLLKSYLKKLTNLSSNNKSLLLLRLSAEQDIDLNQFDYSNGKPSFEIIEHLIAGRNKIVLSDLIDSRNEKVNELSNKLRKIDRRDKFIYEERGAKDLYVGWPFVRGKFTDGTAVRCPLLFFPVSLEVQKGQWILAPRKEVNLSFNKSFLLAYAHFNKVKLKDNLIDKTFEDVDTGSQSFRTTLYELLKDSPLEINFNQELFINKLLSFDTFKKQDYEEKTKTGELKLFSEAVLGIFPQADSYLVPDYDFLLEHNSFNTLEDFFQSRQLNESNEQTGNFNYSNKVKEENTFTPFKLDASQELAIHAAKQGQSIVVQGPPGTGKSQLITNLIADFIARGKKVLLVCQKKAALDIVYQRLKEKEFHDFVGLVHDFKNDRKIIYSQLDEQIEKLQENKHKNNSLDAILLEKNFFQVCRRIDLILAELQEFKTALFDTKECGISIKELYLNSNPNQPSLDLKQEYKFYKEANINSFLQILSAYFPYAVKFEKQDYLWKERISFSNYGIAELRQLNELIDFIPAYQKQISDKAKALSLNIETLESIGEGENLVLEFLSLLKNENIYASFIHLLDLDVEESELYKWEKDLMECYSGVGIEPSLTTDQLKYFSEALEKASQAKKQFAKWVWWKLFSKDKNFIQKVFEDNKLELNEASFKLIFAKLRNRIQLEDTLTRMRACTWLKDLPGSLKQKDFEDWIYNYREAFTARAKLNELDSLNDLLNISALTYADLKTKLSQILSIAKDLSAQRKTWKKLFTPEQINKFSTDPNYPLELRSSLKNDFESLVEFDKIKSALTSVETAVIEKLMKTAPLCLDTAISLFKNSIYLHWIDHIELKHPVLRSVSSLKMEQLEKDLEAGIAEKLKLSREIILLRLRENTYTNTHFNRLNNMVSYRELKHQVTKKKKIWPIRRLVGEFSKELFDLVPCWMASPESVSAMFPMQQLFDLVIFDEASQCYAEKGIPAIFRAKQIVVTGDEKQLAPNDLYQIRWEEEADETPELEIDSLLNLADKYLMQVLLSGHYRSQSLDLIQFSNIHFYKSRLKLLPHFDVVNDQVRGIEYLRVPGIWENNTNFVEAEMVVELVATLVKKNASKSIGIVTFNYKQQICIQDLLEEYFLQNQLNIPETLFVKNIENVQGDERDIIIFSLGYAPDSNGKLLMNFGSLNAMGGENRLNVAVTRAREKNYIVCSLMPQELNVENAKNEGPKLLKMYLEYAWNVSNGNFKPLISSIPSFNNNYFLKSQLTSEFSGQELQLKEEFPFADLAVLKNDNPKGLILTDDQLYYQGISVKESHAYITMDMKEKNWKCKKLFSRQYWANREEVKREMTIFFD